MSELPGNPYVLLTPGPLSTTPTVKAAMLRDWCTWDADYRDIVQGIRRKLVDLATAGSRKEYTSVLMQGSGTFCVEAALGTAIPESGKVLILANGAYGDRMAVIAERLRIAHTVLRSAETERPGISSIRAALRADPSISAVAMVHCETTTGILNPLAEISRLVRESGRDFIVDAMSSFGGIPMDIGKLDVDFLISSANKCIQGVPGFGFVIAREPSSPARAIPIVPRPVRPVADNGERQREVAVHVTHPCRQGVCAGTAGAGRRGRSGGPVCAVLREPSRACCRDDRARVFLSSRRESQFHADLKARGFVIYPGKVSRAATFRIGTIGDVQPATIRSLISAVKDSVSWGDALIPRKVV